MITTEKIANLNFEVSYLNLLSPDMHIYCFEVGTSLLTPNLGPLQKDMQIVQKLPPHWIIM